MCFAFNLPNRRDHGRNHNPATVETGRTFPSAVAVAIPADE
jgi:hypothetical protein